MRRCLGTTPRSNTRYKTRVAELANDKRFELLGLKKLSFEENKVAHSTKSHYETVKEEVEEKFGIKDNFLVDYIQVKGEQITLTGKDLKTIIMTDLFRNSMFLVANELKREIFNEGALDFLSYAREKGYKIAIFSGVRSDIISAMLLISESGFKPDFILGQDPTLSFEDNSLLLKSLNEKYFVEFVIGDKKSDLEPGKEIGANTIFLKGNHSEGNEEDIADYVISSFVEAKNLL